MHRTLTNVARESKVPRDVGSVDWKMQHPHQYTPPALIACICAFRVWIPNQPYAMSHHSSLDGSDTRRYLNTSSFAFSPPFFVSWIIDGGDRLVPVIRWNLVLEMGWRNLFPFFIYFYCFKISEIDIALLQESIDEKGRGKLEPNSCSDNMTTMINFLGCSTIQLT